MYQGWFCSGGTEIINNARAVGYAETASQIANFDLPPIPAVPEVPLDRNLFTNPSAETGGLATEVYRNRLLNPNYNTTSGTVETARNLAINPLAHPTGAGSFISNSAAVWTVTREDVGVSSNPQGITTRAKSVFNGAQTNPILMSMYNVDGLGNVNPARAVGAWFYVTNTGYEAWVGSAADTVRVTLPNGQWTWVAGNTVSANSYAGAYVRKITGNAGASDIAYITGVTALTVGTPSATIAGGTPFPTSASPDAALSTAWVGTANASETTQTGARVSNVTVHTPSTLAPYRIGAVGDYSARFVTVSNGALAIAAGDVGGTENSTYTLLMRVRSNDRVEMVRPRVSGVNGPDVSLPQGQWVDILTTQVAGITNALTTGIYVYPDAARPYGTTIDVQYAVLIDGAYGGGYFDGSSPRGMRRNYVRDPRFTVTGSTWTLTSSTGTVTDGVYDITTTAPLTSNFVTPPLTWFTTIQGGDRVSASYKVENVGTISATFRVAIWNGGIYNYGSFVTINPGETAVVKADGLLAPNGSSYMQPRLHGTAASAGVHVLVSEPIVERALTVGPYFDGSRPSAPGFTTEWAAMANDSTSTQIDGDFTTAWLGAPDASESRMLGISVVSVNPVSTLWADAFRSAHWASAGNFSLRVTPVLSASVANTSAGAWIDMAPFTEIGKTYTILATVRKTSAATVNPATYGAVDIYDGAYRPRVTTPNAAGVYEVRLTATRPGATFQLRFVHGQPAGTADDLWIDSIAVIEGDFTQSWFSGDTLPADGLEYRWLGEPNASASERFIPEIPAQAQQYCDITWFDNQDEDCLQNLFGALDEEVPYEASYIPEAAPWYSETSGFLNVGPSRKFLGAYGLGVTALGDSTREVPSTEGILSGGVMGRERLAMPRFRFRVALTAVDEEGLEYGKAWLTKALAEQSCNTHGPSCGSSDLTFFAACPPERIIGNGPPAAYEDKLNSLTRVYHDVKCTSGPITTQGPFERGANSWGMIVEFILQAGVANMFGAPAPFIAVSQDGETVINDIARNDLPYPSAEINGSDITVARNYSLNPSVETNATGWTVASAAASGASPAPYLTSGRVTGELSSSGTSSFRHRLLGNGSTAATGRALLYAIQTVDVAARPAGSAVSVGIWAALVKIAGSAATVTHGLSGLLIWRNAANAQVGASVSLGVGNVGGHAFTAKSLLPPAGATKAELVALADVSWESSATPANNSDLRLYADAVIVSVP